MTDTRQKLLDAAWHELLEFGWEATTGAAIKKRARAKQGSWAHFFPQGKAQIGELIYTDLHRELWESWAAALGDRADTDQAVVQKTVSALLGSVENRPGAWRLLFELETALPQLRREAAVLSAHRD